MEINGHFIPMAALAAPKNPPVTSKQETGWLLGHGDEEANLCPCKKSNPDALVAQPIS
jgi:hypothetical protein